MSHAFPRDSVRFRSDEMNGTRRVSITAWTRAEGRRLREKWVKEGDEERKKKEKIGAQTRARSFGTWQEEIVDATDAHDTHVSTRIAAPRRSTTLALPMELNVRSLFHCALAFARTGCLWPSSRSSVGDRTDATLAVARVQWRGHERSEIAFRSIHSTGIGSKISETPLLSLPFPSPSPPSHVRVNKRNRMEAENI